MKPPTLKTRLTQRSRETRLAALIRPGKPATRKIKAV